MIKNLKTCPSIENLNLRKVICPITFQVINFLNLKILILKRKTKSECSSNSNSQSSSIKLRIAKRRICQSKLKVLDSIIAPMLSSSKKKNR